MASFKSFKKKNNERRKEKSKWAARDRRTKESDLFNELAEVVPLVAGPTVTHVDRIAMLRVAAALCRARRLAPLLNHPESGAHVKLDPLLYHEDSLSKCLDGFLLVCDQDGVIVFVSQAIAAFVGLTQWISPPRGIHSDKKTDLVGRSVRDFVHPSDVCQLIDVSALGAKGGQVGRGARQAGGVGQAQPIVDGLDDELEMQVDVDGECDDNGPIEGEHGVGDAAQHAQAELMERVPVSGAEKDPDHDMSATPPALAPEQDSSNDPLSSMGCRKVVLRIKSVISPRGRNLNLRSATYKAVSFNMRTVHLAAGQSLPLGSPSGVDNVSARPPHRPGRGGGGKKKGAGQGGNGDGVVSKPTVVRLLHGMPETLHSYAAAGNALAADGSAQTALITRHTCDMKFSYCNESVLTLLGYDPKSLVGTSFYNLVFAQDLPALAKSLKDLFSKGYASTGYYRVMHGAGGHCWLSTDAATVTHTTRGHKGRYVVAKHTVVASSQRNTNVLGASKNMSGVNAQQMGAGAAPPLDWLGAKNVNMDDNEATASGRKQLITRLGWLGGEPFSPAGGRQSLHAPAAHPPAAQHTNAAPAAGPANGQATSGLSGKVSMSVGRRLSNLAQCQVGNNPRPTHICSTSLAELSAGQWPAAGGRAAQAPPPALVATSTTTRTPLTATSNSSAGRLASEATPAHHQVLQHQTRSEVLVEPQVNAEVTQSAQATDRPQMYSVIHASSDRGSKVLKWSTSGSPTVCAAPVSLPKPEAKPSPNNNINIINNNNNNNNRSAVSQLAALQLLLHAHRRPERPAPGQMPTHPHRAPTDGTNHTGNFAVPQSSADAQTAIDILTMSGNSGLLGRVGTAPQASQDGSRPPAGLTLPLWNNRVVDTWQLAPGQAHLQVPVSLHRSATEITAGGLANLPQDHRSSAGEQPRGQLGRQCRSSADLQAQRFAAEEHLARSQLQSGASASRSAAALHSQTEGDCVPLTPIMALADDRYMRTEALPLFLSASTWGSRSAPQLVHRALQARIASERLQMDAMLIGHLWDAGQQLPPEQQEPNSIQASTTSASSTLVTKANFFL